MNVQTVKPYLVKLIDYVSFSSVPFLYRVNQIAVAEDNLLIKLQLIQILCRMRVYEVLLSQTFLMQHNIYYIFTNLRLVSISSKTSAMLPIMIFLCSSRGFEVR